MKKPLKESIVVQLVFLSFIVFISRIPFLWAGYGSEEDSWLLPLTAKNIALSGAYEMSRAPGHPIQELIYSLMWNAGPVAYNLLSALASVVAVVFFALALKNLNFKPYLFASFAFAFTPVVFISSTYTIDYMLAMAFVMGSFYCITSPLAGARTWLSCIFLGIAIGFRLTSAAMLIPFAILLFAYRKSGLKRVSLFICLTSVVGILTYLPVIKTYGLSFFTYSDQFPYPNFPKVFFKATSGVFGLTGIVAIIIFFASSRTSPSAREKGQANFTLKEGSPGAVILACTMALIIYILSYLRLPQKSAYLIPAIPFIILLFGYHLSNKAFKIFCVLLTLSSFFLSVNLTDPLRGSVYSPMSIKFKMAGQEIFIDPFTGPVFADYTKRLNKIAFTERVYRQTMNEERKIVLICGWWHNELLVRGWNSEPNRNVVSVFYIDRITMEKYQSEGYEIYYLPEQNIYNDQFFKMNFTDLIAKRYI
jgi:hypothetical protein